MFVSEDLPNIPDVFYHVNAPRAIIKEYTPVSFSKSKASCWPDYVLSVIVQDEKGVKKEVTIFGDDEAKDGWVMKKSENRSDVQFFTTEIDYGLSRIWDVVKSGAYSRANALLKEYKNKCPELML